MTQADRLRERELGFEPKRLYEEYAYVMDFLPTGRSSPDKSRYVVVPTAQVLGEDYFTMLEAELKHGFKNRQRFLFKNLLTEYIERVKFLQEMQNNSAI